MVHKLLTHSSDEEEEIWKRFILWSDNNSETNPEENAGVTDLLTYNVNKSKKDKKPSTIMTITDNSNSYTYLSYFSSKITDIYQYFVNLFWYRK